MFCTFIFSNFSPHISCQATLGLLFICLEPVLQQG